MIQQTQYSSTQTVTITETTSQTLAWTIAEAADDRKAADIVLLRVAEISYLSDYFVIVTGFSKTQVRAIADSIEDKVAKLYNQQPLHIAGKAEGNWILQDYGDVIVHILLPAEREFYNLEAFWGHAERINFEMSN
jgi:ribosome-associated protein